MAQKEAFFSRLKDKVSCKFHLMLATLSFSKFSVSLNFNQGKRNFLGLVNNISAHIVFIRQCGGVELKLSIHLPLVRLEESINNFPLKIN